MAISNIKLIIGLGNPEEQYTNTRHNIGYRVVDELINKYQAYWHIWNQLIVLGGDKISFFSRNNVHLYVNYSNKLDANLYIGYKKLILLLKPTTGMNSSGESILKACNEFKLKPSQILVIYDDINLPIGTIRVREAGSSGGHKGVQSIIDCLETRCFNRLRIGVGKPDKTQSILDYVLSEETNIEATNMSIKKAAEVVDYMLDGIIKQGDTFNYVT